MKLSEFDYHLPGELIAQYPIEPRDASRLMVVGKQIDHRFFCDVPDYFEAGDTLVLNDSRVIPAKLIGKKSTGGHVEALVVSRNEAGYECMIRGKNIHEGTRLSFGELGQQCSGYWRGPTQTGILLILIAMGLSLIHISEPTRLGMISYAVFCLKKKKQK